MQIWFFAYGYEEQVVEMFQKINLIFRGMAVQFRKISTITKYDCS